MEIVKLAEPVTNKGGLTRELSEFWDMRSEDGHLEEDMNYKC